MSIARRGSDTIVKKVFMIAATGFFILGCTAGKQGPVLYPNKQLKDMGETQAQTDISECSQSAEQYVKSNPGAKVVKGTIVGGAGGAVVGGAVGAATGHLGRGAAIGGVAGATTGLVRGLYKASKPGPVYKAFVERCLREKGYEPIGWE